MTAQEAVVAKVRRLPEPLAQEVGDYVDFLLARRDTTHSFPSKVIAEEDFSSYLSQLEAYEVQLAHGEIKW